MHHQGDAQDFIEWREDGGVQARPLRERPQKGHQLPEGLCQGKKQRRKARQGHQKSQFPLFSLEKQRQKGCQHRQGAKLDDALHP